MIGLKSIAKTALALSASGALLSGCGDAASEGDLGGALPRQQTLYLSGGFLAGGRTLQPDVRTAHHLQLPEW